MLSYKLKHLCSRVIASLSAIGLVSITGEAHAATQLSGNFSQAKPGDYFTYNRTSSMTMNAQYGVNVQTGCSMTLSDGSDGNFASAVYTAGVTGTGTSGEIVVLTGASCTYVCADGYRYGTASGSGSGIVVGGTGSASELYITPGTGCVAALTLNCSFVSGSGVASVAKVVNSSGVTGCEWTCADGYTAASDAKIHDASFSGAYGVTGTVYPSGYGTCQARQFTVTFDCGAGTISGESYSTGTAIATYGSVFTIPTDAWCVRDGYTFTGWSGSL